MSGDVPGGAGSGAGSGGSGSPPSEGSFFQDYVNPDAGTLMGRIDWSGMVSRLFRSWFLGVVSLLTGAVLAIRQSYGGYVADVEHAGGQVWDTLMGFPVQIQREATRAAAQDLAMFDLFAGPVSVAVALVGIGVVSFIVYVFIIGGD